VAGVGTVVARLGQAPPGAEAAVLEIAVCLMLAFGLALQFYLGWRPWESWLPQLVVAADIVAVTLLLLAYIAVNRSIVATNSQLFFFYYLFIIVSTGLRANRRLSRLVAWALPVSYFLVVFLAVAWRQAQVAAQPDPEYGSFRWEVQVVRVLALAVFALMITYDVGLVATTHAEARTDPLTGVYNRRFLEEFLGREIARSRRGQQPLSILLLDLDGFKAFNDRHGHLAGDQTLAAVAAGLRDGVRATDVVARFGGDEFVVVLPNTPGENARRIARELTQTLPQPLRFSVGIACLGEDVLSAADLIAIADAGLMRAKRTGAGLALLRTGQNGE
jgi:diguanylate cyclase (GGDEF)-like protein